MSDLWRFLPSALGNRAKESMNNTPGHLVGTLDKTNIKSSPEHKQLIWNLIKNVKVGMLTTKENDRDAQLRARPMTLVQDAYDGTLFFFSSHSDAKVFEIEHDRDVCVSFSDPNSGVYVSLTGKGNVNTDSTVIDRYWSDDMAAWFEQGKEDPNLAMIEVKISKGEHWNVKENKLAQYLETATDVNINIYAREGFEVYDRMHADGKDPMTVNFLRRLPIKQLTDPDLAEPNHKQMSMANMAD